jgi:hypothetical protein
MTEGEAKGVAAGAIEAGGKLLGSLPAQMLVLVMLNLVFIFALFWFLNSRDTARERLLTPILAACMQLPRSNQ